MIFLCHLCHLPMPRGWPQDFTQIYLYSVNIKEQMFSYCQHQTSQTGKLPTNQQLYLNFNKHFSFSLRLGSLQVDFDFETIICKTFFPKKDVLNFTRKKCYFTVGSNLSIIPKIRTDGPEPPILNFGSVTSQ